MTFDNLGPFTFVYLFAKHFERMAYSYILQWLRDRVESLAWLASLIFNMAGAASELFFGGIEG